MVSNGKYYAVLGDRQTLREDLNNANQCNARLMAEIIGLCDEIKRLTAEVKSLREVVSAKDYIMRRMDNERLKTAQGKHDITAKYAAVCQIISDMDSDASKRYFCDYCKHSDGIVCCSSNPNCTFEVK